MIAKVSKLLHDSIAYGLNHRADAVTQWNANAATAFFVTPGTPQQDVDAFETAALEVWRDDGPIETGSDGALRTQIDSTPAAPSRLPGMPEIRLRAIASSSSSLMAAKSSAVRVKPTLRPDTPACGLRRSARRRFAAPAASCRSATPAAAAAAKGAPFYLPLDPFIVNLADKDAARDLRDGVELGRLERLEDLQPVLDVLRQVRVDRLRVRLGVVRHRHLHAQTVAL